MNNRTSIDGRKDNKLIRGVPLDLSFLSISCMKGMSENDEKKTPPQRETFYQRPPTSRPPVRIKISDTEDCETTIAIKKKANH